MPPSPEERLAKLEAETMHMKELLVEVRTELRRLPKRIGNNTKRQLEQCRVIQNGKYSQIFTDTQKPAKPKPADPEPTDWTSLKKIMVGLLMLGALIGGAVYQFSEQQNRKTRTQQTQGAQP